jgi:hypothetical protein
MQKFSRNDFQFVDDRRTGTALLSVLIAPFAPGASLSRTLSALPRSPDVEVIIVEAPPSALDGVVYGWRKPNAFVYARFIARASKQKCWNAALSLCKGKFVALLQGDESPDVPLLSTAFDELRQSGEVDWVFPNATWDRSPSVSGVYRKDLHRLFGYYDEVTEDPFQLRLRVLPKINHRFV